jgi:tetratricopeptide (TPR) repeat protein
MQITSRKINTSHLTANDGALDRCQKALELRDKGDFDSAQEAMSPLWKGIGDRPDISGLHPTVVPEVLLCVGILTGWIGSRNEIKEADGWARDLITESITFYESAGDIKKVAEARTELAYCYWREGSFDEARIMFTEALKKLTTEGKTRANALLGLAVVERSSSRYVESMSRIKLPEVLILAEPRQHIPTMCWVTCARSIREGSSASLCTTHSVV